MPVATLRPIPVATHNDEVNEDVAATHHVEAVADRTLPMVEELYAMQTKPRH